MDRNRATVLTKGTLALLFLIRIVSGEALVEKTWKNLGHTNRESIYTAETRDGHCITGRIESIDDRSITISQIKIDRNDVIRVSDGTPVTGRDPIYNAVSSWRELAGSEPNQYEHIELKLKDGSTRNCRKFYSGVDSAACDGGQIAKTEVELGYYVRLAPATEREHYLSREGVLLLDPRSWFNFAFYPRIKVLLYDASVPEQHLNIGCKAS